MNIKRIEELGFRVVDDPDSVLNYLPARGRQDGVRVEEERDDSGISGEEAKKAVLSPGVLVQIVDPLNIMDTGLFAITKEQVSLEGLVALGFGEVAGVTGEVIVNVPCKHTDEMNSLPPAEDRYPKLVELAQQNQRNSQNSL